MRTRSAVGILVGGVLDIMATTVLTFPLMVYVAATRDLARLAPAEQGARRLGELQTPGLQTAGWALGLAATALGGYVAARIARRAELAHGALSSWLCDGLGVHGLRVGPHTARLWQHLLAFVLSPAIGAFGGYLRQRQLASGRGASLRPAAASLYASIGARET